MQFKLLALITITAISVNTEGLRSFSQSNCAATHIGKLRPYQMVIPRQCFTTTKAGKCFGNIQSFHYDPKDGQCKESTFGGCDDGCLAYQAQKECEESCQRATGPVEPEDSAPFTQSQCSIIVPKNVKKMYDEIPATCFIKSVAGKCRQNLPSYHFDIQLERCVESNFGGCDDGCQAFKTLTECENGCNRFSIDV